MRKAIVTGFVGVLLGACATKWDYATEKDVWVDDIAMGVEVVPTGPHQFDVRTTPSMFPLRAGDVAQDRNRAQRAGEAALLKECPAGTTPFLVSLDKVSGSTRFEGRYQCQDKDRGVASKAGGPVQPVSMTVNSPVTVTVTNGQHPSPPATAAASQAGAPPSDRKPEASSAQQ